MLGQLARGERELPANIPQSVMFLTIQCFRPSDKRLAESLTCVVGHEFWKEAFTYVGSSTLLSDTASVFAVCRVCRRPRCVYMAARSSAGQTRSRPNQPLGVDALLGAVVRALQTSGTRSVLSPGCRRSCFGKLCHGQVRSAQQQPSVWDVYNAATHWSTHNQELRLKKVNPLPLMHAHKDVVCAYVCTQLLQKNPTLQ